MRFNDIVRLYRINYTGNIPKNVKNHLTNKLRHYVYSKKRDKDNWVVREKVGDEYYTLSYNQGIGRIIGKQETSEGLEEHKRYRGKLGVFGFFAPFYFFTITIGYTSKLYIIPNVDVVSPFRFSISSEEMFKFKVKEKDGALKYLFSDGEKEQFIELIKNSFKTELYPKLKWEDIFYGRDFRDYVKNTYTLYSETISSSSFGDITWEGYNYTSKYSGSSKTAYSIVQSGSLEERVVFDYGSSSYSGGQTGYDSPRAFRRSSWWYSSTSSKIRAFSDLLFNIRGWIPEEGHPYLEGQSISENTVLYIRTASDSDMEDGVSSYEYDENRSSSAHLVIKFLDTDEAYVIDSGSTDYDKWGVSSFRNHLEYICDLHNAEILDGYTFESWAVFSTPPRKMYHTESIPSNNNDRFTGYDSAVNEYTKAYGIFFHRYNQTQSSKSDATANCWDYGSDDDFCSNCERVHDRLRSMNEGCDECYSGYTFWGGTWAEGWNNVTATYNEESYTYHFRTPLQPKKQIAECTIGRGYDSLVQRDINNLPKKGTYVFTYTWSHIELVNALIRFMNVTSVIYAFRNTPSIKIWDISDSAIGDIYQNLVTYWYILVDAETENFVEFVYGYELLAFDSFESNPRLNIQNSVSREFKCEKIEESPTVAWKVLEGVGGDMNRFTGEPYFFYVTAIHPFWQSEPVEITVSSDALSVPNGGIELEITIPKSAMGFNVFVPNIDASYSFIQEPSFNEEIGINMVGHYKLIHTEYLDTPNNVYTGKLHLYTYAAHKIEAQSTEIYTGIILNESYYDPFFVLKPDKETMDFSELRFYTNE